MVKKKSAAKQASGGARLIASGKRPVLLGLSVEDHDLIRQAAATERRPLTQFLIYHGVNAARRALSRGAR